MHHAPQREREIAAVAGGEVEIGAAGGGQDDRVWNLEVPLTAHGPAVLRAARDRPSPAPTAPVDMAPTIARWRHGCGRLGGEHPHPCSPGSLNQGVIAGGDRQL